MAGEGRRDQKGPWAGEDPGDPSDPDDPARGDPVHKDDKSTCATSHDSRDSLSRDSLTSSSTVESSGGNDGNGANMYPCSMAAPSSITTSTCDFAPEPDLHVVFESYLQTNPWEAARRGDYATLSFIADYDDAAIWTQVDEHGRVPLYYACTSYNGGSRGSSDGRGNGGCGGAAAPQSFGKYGLESVALLLRAWPEDADLPGDVLDLCGERGDSVHADVAEVLSRSHRVRDAVILPPLAARTETRINGVSEVVPVSFLEDLGDDGYVEDY